MKKLWSMFAILAALFIVSCSDDYDDTAIKNQINDLENRVTSLEQLCQQMNTNISSMQTILNALQERDYITSVTPIKEGDAVIGYTINFAINDPITIYHGKNGAAGKDGYVPVIGVAKFEDDGLYYWTLDGEWLTDAEGNKVRAQGLDGGAGNGGSEGSAGKDGITPLLKIKLNFWYISYDNGATWERLGPATGVDGADGRPGQDGDSFFKDVYKDKNGYVHFVLVSGDEYIVPAKGTLEAQLKDLQNLIDNNYHIKSYEAITDDTGATGYRLVLVKDGKEETITIKNGKDGAPGEPGTQITVTEENGSITIVVGEGEDADTITIPKYNAMSVSISVAEDDTNDVESGTVKTLNVEFTGNPTIKTVICNWPAKIEGWDETEKTAKVKVTVPKSTTAGDSEAVTILVSDGSHTAMNTITLVVTKKTTYKVGDIYEVTIKDGSKKKAVVISINNPSEDGYGTSGKVMAIEEWTGLKYYGTGSENQAKSAFAHYGTDWTMPYKSDWNNSISANFQTIQAAIEANDGTKLNTTNGVKYWAEERDKHNQGSLGQLSTAGTISWSTASNHTGCVRAVLAVSEF